MLDLIFDIVTLLISVILLTVTIEFFLRNVKEIFNFGGLVGLF